MSAVYLIIGGVVMYFLFRRRPVKPPTSLVLRREEMKIKAVWEKSLSTHVVKQTLSYSWEGVDPIAVELGPDVTEFSIMDVPAVKVTVGIVASSAFKSSPALVGEVDVVDMSEPLPPTGLVLTVEE
jgi:hypothetical protein